MALLSYSCQIVDKSSLPYHSEPQQKPSPPGHTQRSLRKASRQLEVKSVWVRDQAASPSREPLTLLATCASSILGCLCHLFLAAGIWGPPPPLHLSLWNLAKSSVSGLLQLFIQLSAPSQQTAVCISFCLLWIAHGVSPRP